MYSKQKTYRRCALRTRMYRISRNRSAAASCTFVNADKTPAELWRWANICTRQYCIGAWTNGQRRRRRRSRPVQMLVGQLSSYPLALCLPRSIRKKFIIAKCNNTYWTNARASNARMPDVHIGTAVVMRG